MFALIYSMSVHVACPYGHSYTVKRLRRKTKFDLWRENAPLGGRIRTAQTRSRRSIDLLKRENGITEGWWTAFLIRPYNSLAGKTPTYFQVPQFGTSLGLPSVDGADYTRNRI